MSFENDSFHRETDDIYRRDPAFLGFIEDEDSQKPAPHYSRGGGGGGGGGKNNGCLGCGSLAAFFAGALFLFFVDANDLIIFIYIVVGLFILFKYCLK